MPPHLSKSQKVGFVISALILTSNEKKKKRMWAKKWLQERKKYTHLNLLKELDSDDFKNFLRMNEKCFKNLLSMVKPLIEKQNTKLRESVSAEERLIVTLRYLATGRSFEDLKFSAAISPQLLSSIIPETCAAIYKCLKHYLKLPATEEDWKAVARQFSQRWNFANVLGAVDGKHVAILKPPNSGSVFYNYKKFFSIILFAIVDANYQFMYVHVGTNGSASDAAVFKNTKFYEKLVNNSLNLPNPTRLPGSATMAPFVFLGDSAFGLNSHFMKPYALKQIAHNERIFNYRLSRARRVVENAFGILASRFRVFQQAISINLVSVDSVVLACCALHNYLSQENSHYLTQFSVDREDTENMQIHTGEWRESSQPLPSLDSSLDARKGYEEGKNVRKIFTDYFLNEGKVSFQEHMTRIVME